MKFIILFTIFIMFYDCSVAANNTVLPFSGVFLYVEETGKPAPYGGRRFARFFC